MSNENPPKPKRKKLGRPKVSDDVRKEFTLRVRMPVSMKSALEAAAKREYMTASELIRKLLKRHLEGC